MFALPSRKTQKMALENANGTRAPKIPALDKRVTPRERLLHRSIGDLAMLSLLSQRARDLTESRSGNYHEPGAEEVAQAAQSPSSDVTEVPIFPSNRSNRPLARSSVATLPLPGVQRRLVVGQIDDPLEHEADRIAEQVMRMPDPEASITGTQPQLSRKCAACEEEVQTLQAKPTGSFKAALGEAPRLVHEVLGSPGQPLNLSRAFSWNGVLATTSAACACTRIRLLLNLPKRSTLEPTQ